MFFSRIVSAFIISAAFVSAAPTPAKKVDIQSTVDEALTTLKATTDQILPQIAAITSPISEAIISPLLQEIVGALNTATSTIGAIEASTPISGELDATAQLLSSVIKDINDAVAPILDEVLSIPAVAELIQGTVNPLLNTLLTIVDGLLPGVLPIAAGLLGQVTGLLSALGLGGVVGVLGKNL